MKGIKILSIALLFSVAGFSQSFTSPITANLKRPAPSAVGVVLDEISWASLTNYSNNGSGITVSGGQLNMTGGSATFNDYLLWNDASSDWLSTACENWTISVKAIAPTINSTSYGFGVGTRCTNSFIQMSAVFRWAWDTSAGLGIAMYPNNSVTGQLTSGSFTTPTSGATVWFDVVRAKNVYTCTAYASNHTTVLITATFTMSLSSGTSNQSGNTGKWVLENFGGTNLKILEWKITINESKNVDGVYVGDSNSVGLFAGSNASRFVQAAPTARSRTFAVLAGIGDRTADINSRIKEIRALNPKYCYISMGRNDIANSVSTGTWQTNIDTFISTVKSYGIVVRPLGVIASNVDVSAVQTYWTGKTSLTQVNFYTATKGAGTTLAAGNNSGDNIHLNSTGHGVCSTSLQTIIP